MSKHVGVYIISRNTVVQYNCAFVGFNKNKESSADFFVIRLFLICLMNGSFSGYCTIFFVKVWFKSQGNVEWIIHNSWEDWGEE